MPNTNKNGTAGQPTKMRPEVIQSLRNAFDIGASVREACAFADIGVQTLYDYFKRNPEFKEETERRKQKPVLQAKLTLMKSLQNTKNGDLSLKYLERKCKDEFSLKTEVDTSVNIANDALDKLGRIINGKSD